MVKENPRVKTHLSSLSAADRLVLCTIVRGEVLYGLELMAQGKKRRDLEPKVRELFAMIPCEAVPEAAGNQYARIKRRTEREGGRLDENDLWIAATALSMNAILVTTDSDFQPSRGCLRRVHPLVRHALGMNRGRRIRSPHFRQTRRN